MRLNQRFAGGMVAVLVIVSPPLNLVRTAAASPQYLAQVTPNTVTGQLDENSETLEDGSYYNVHTFEGKAGETVNIELASEAFDTYLILLGPDGQSIAENDDGNSGTNSRIVVTLTANGTYQIIANTYGAGETGQYTLTWQPTKAADVAQAEALQRAAALSSQVEELYQAGRYEEAIPLAEEALAILREQLGNHHSDVAISLNNLATLYRARGRYAAAELLYQESLAILREQFGERYSAVAINLNNLAALYVDEGRYGEAETLFQEALAILREQLGEHHPNIVASSLKGLAELYYALSRYDEAESHYLEALAILREQLGERHPNVANSLNSLATLYHALSRYDEAESHYLEALAILREQLGEHHPSVADSLNGLAMLHEAQGQYGEAEQLLKQVLEIDRRTYGDIHLNVATSLNNLAVSRCG